MVYAPLQKLGKSGSIPCHHPFVYQHFRDRRHGGAVVQRCPGQLPPVFVEIFHYRQPPYMDYRLFRLSTHHCSTVSGRVLVSQGTYCAATSKRIEGSAGSDPATVVWIPHRPCRHSRRCPWLTKGSCFLRAAACIFSVEGAVCPNRWRAEPDSNRLPPAVLRVCFRKHLLPVLPPALMPRGDIHCLGIILTSDRSFLRISSIVR